MQRDGSQHRGDHEQTRDMPQGAWVVQFDCSDVRPRIGLVRDAYEFDGEWLLDIVLYAHDGTRIGRESPACGGPKGFEPACAASRWEPIDKPDFDRLSKTSFWGRSLRRLREPGDAPPAKETT